MFSGIIERLGKVANIHEQQGSKSFHISTGFEDLALGESVAINGVCLTVAAFKGRDEVDFFASPETLARSNLSALQMGSIVNLERSVNLNTRLSGHMVQGHVDGKAVLGTIVSEAGAYKLTFDIPAALARYCVEKGSIALNGISLTINTLEELTDRSLRIGLTIIPHTWEHTNLHAATVGDIINVEVDVMAKYVERLCQPYLKP